LKSEGKPRGKMIFDKPWFCAQAAAIAAGSNFLFIVKILA